MTIQSFTFNPFMTNGYVAHDGGEAALIDAPSHTEAEHHAVLDYLEKERLTVRHLLLTHAHIDHIFGCAFFADYFDLKWQVHAADAFLVEQAAAQAQAFGVKLSAAPPAEQALQEGGAITVGEATLEVLHTPGHSPGSACFVERRAGQALSGDVLFQGSIGRVEGLPQTSLPQLMNSIREKLLPLGDDVSVHPGHGSATTVGREREHNPFLNGAVNLDV